MQAAQTRNRAKKQRKYSQEEKNEAATKIQALFRGHLDRKKDLDAIKLRLLKKAPEENCHICTEEYDSEKKQEQFYYVVNSKYVKSA
jgi:hypothetical protein